MSDMHSSRTVQAAVFVALVAVAAGSRFVGAEANFAAISSAALFAGFFFRNRLVAVAVPVLAMLVSDLVHGFYHPALMAVVYAGLAVPVVFRPLLGAVPTITRVLGCAMLGSVSFFLFTNLGVWALGDGAAYPKTAEGLAQCYIAAIPFFRGTLAGDLVYSGVFFGVYAAVRMTLARRQAAMAAA